MPEDNNAQEHPLGPTEELLAKADAETVTSTQQVQPNEQNVEPQSQGDSFLETALEREKQQAEGREQSESKDQEQREREGQQNSEAEPSRWLDAPQDEGVLSHPTPDASPASPGKEQHQQTVAAEAGEQGGGMKKTISTKTQLGAVVTLDGIYTVPRYQTVIKETPIQDKASPSRQRGREQDMARDRDRSMER